MESREKRKVRSGVEYDSLFPRPSGKNILIKKDANVRDTVTFIQKSVPKTAQDTAMIAPLLKRENLKETCRNVWDFVYKHIPYKRDRAGVEEVRRPARAWHDRNHPDENGEVGVDCDCYSVFISSILHNLNIPHVLRITKYWKKDPSEIRWQHIYPIVPVGGMNGDTEYRNDYIVLDCVKEAFDDEEPYLEKKDFGMRLEYLDGIDDEEEYIVPNNKDLRDLADLYGEEDMGKLGQWVKKTAKKVGSAVGKTVKFLNRFTNPATILLRNGFLAAMKLNVMKVAGKLRYGYLSNEQAQARGMNLQALAKLKKVLDKAEKIYEGAGGKKANLKKAILSGKGNKNGKIPLSGFEDDDGVYADRDEYNVLFGLEGFGELGEPVTAASVAAATATITALAGALSQVKGLFQKGTPESKEFDSAPSSNKEGSSTVDLTSTEDNSSDSDAAQSQSIAPASQKRIASPSGQDSQSLTLQNNQITTQNTPGENSNTETASEEPVKFTKSPVKWVKQNPGKSLLYAGILIGTGYLISRAISKKPSVKKSSGSLDGLPKRRRTKKRKSSTGRKKTKGKGSLYLKAITIKD